MPLFEELEQYLTMLLAARYSKKIFSNSNLCNKEFDWLLSLRKKEGHSPPPVPSRPEALTDKSEE